MALRSARPWCRRGSGRGGGGVREARHFVLGFQGRLRLEVRGAPRFPPRGSRFPPRGSRFPPTGSRQARAARVPCAGRRGLTLAPIWLPHWPAWMCTISLMSAGGGRLREADGPGGCGAPAARRSYRLCPARRALRRHRAANGGAAAAAARPPPHLHRVSARLARGWGPAHRKGGAGGIQGGQ